MWSISGCAQLVLCVRVKGEVVQSERCEVLQVLALACTSQGQTRRRVIACCEANHLKPVLLPKGLRSPSGDRAPAMDPDSFEVPTKKGDTALARAVLDVKLETEEWAKRLPQATFGDPNSVRSQAAPSWTQRSETLKPACL